MSITAEQLEALMPDGTQVESEYIEMESTLHYLQLALLVSCLDWLWKDRTDYFIGGNLTIYFSRQQLRNRDFRGPDFFLVRNTSKRPRKSWVVWEEEGKHPDLIIELLSNSTAETDKTTKKSLYQDQFRTQEYFWFSPDDLELTGFKLIGQEYQVIIPNQQGLLASEVLGLFLGIYQEKLRYFTPEGDLVPTPEEAALQAENRANEAENRANEAQNRAKRLAEQLRSLGIEPIE
ncbi:Uma2 family endonuclease [Planktothrix agardhii]|jgi:Uma2 family endonuclease|uniref:Putative restriction endonuclease domain-containing protein n=1 Tax=Planktothrix agardhii TaxID=1160 RepID=A0AAD1V6C4_PLAAG|nr:Uma2 family endonuclease [Planktothrix agardhii]MCB8759019.1 Uma2 family endonuclease [Planktothrix agardhii 1813]MCB8765241.1 Uma2 family endonuclease [Planktothrix agardhii 1809]MCB8778877.1 Uma2 family endonuclease [Planktothrix agardhii 1031]MCB8783298.1 Uma2 family endonuclease [Planktothrix agardhii 1808]MCF3565678.1 Uma2 family endonuclease [Planktothrix agardhii 1807]